MSPLVKEFAKHEDYFDVRVCVTAQHREMLDQVLRLFEIVPDYDLNIMKPGQDLYDVTTNVLLGIRDVLDEFQPELAFVHGDTTTSMATALACFYKQIKIAHVEAGLRTYNLQSPWPEEANRQITGRIADYNFAPTKLSEQNLLSEGRDQSSIFVTGNTVIDALHWVLTKNKKDTIKERLLEKINESGYNISEREYVLITGHRRENFGQGFQNICNAIKEIAQQNPQVDLVYPVHLNPNVRTVVFTILKDIKNVHLIEPMDYQPFTLLMSKAKIILTDSGGIQEEAPSLGIPVIVMRENTERPEAVKAGTVVLTGTDKNKIIENVQTLLHDNEKYKNMSNAHNPYGDGKACKRIVGTFLDKGKK